MANELIINSRPHETRVALIENSVVSELHIERKTGQELIGNIYRGKVVRVLPGMQAAFVDIGLERSAFLYVSDVHQDILDLEQMMLRNSTGSEEVLDGSAEESDREPLRGISFNIEDLLHEGQDIMVQISKEPIGTKGARLTSHISLPSRHLVLMPNVNHIGISRRIEDPVERERLRGIIQELRPENVGFILRTASERADKSKLKSEMDFLQKLWASIQERMARTPGTGLLYKDLSISLRSVRDLFTREVDRLVIDSKEEYNHIMEFIETFVPSLRYSVELYEGPDPVFDFYGIEMEISRALEKKIWLKSGGYIVIELTEALTAVDVNTGLCGVPEILKKPFSRQIWKLLRKSPTSSFEKPGRSSSTSSIWRKRPIEIGFFTVLKEALSRDKAKTHILRMSELGLIEMTRKASARTPTDSSPSPALIAREGSLKSRKTICFEIFRDLERETSCH
jgi:ribonuclease G